MISIINLSFYFGITGNIFLALIYLFFSFKLFQSSITKQKSEINNNHSSFYFYFFFGCSMLTFSLGVLSVNNLYTQIYFTPIDLTFSQTPFPALMWILNTLFLFFLYLSFSLYSHKNVPTKTSISLLYLFISFINGILFLNSYIVYWNNGAVLVYYINKNGELYNSLLNVLLMVLLSYQLLMNIFEEKNSKNFLSQKIQFFLAVLILIGILFIPRTYFYSFTNAFSVKFISYVFYYSFLIVAYYAMFKPQLFTEKFSILLKIPFLKRVTANFTNFSISLDKKINPLLNISLLSLMILILLAFLSKFGSLILPISVVEANKLDLLFYIGKFNSTNYYVNIIGGFFPIFVSIILFIFLFMKGKFSKLFFQRIGFIIFVGIIFSFILNFYLKLNIRGENGDYPFLFGFIFSCFLVIIINIFFFDSSNFEKNYSLFELFFQLLSPYELYLGTVLSLLVYDLIQPPSLTGIYVIGGGGLSDALLLLPLELIVFLFLCTSLLSCLVIQINQLYVSIDIDRLNYSNDLV